jgi:hypothetical protein
MNFIIITILDGTKSWWIWSDTLHYIAKSPGREMGDPSPGVFGRLQQKELSLRIFLQYIIIVP